ncbi:hypothetical protein Tco_1142382 [Tanacetum coccineum]
MTNNNIADIPFDAKEKYTPTDVNPLCDPSLYHKIVGSLVYFTVTRSSSAYVVHIVRTQFQKLLFPSASSLDLRAYCDVDWAGDLLPKLSIMPWLAIQIAHNTNFMKGPKGIEVEEEGCGDGGRAFNMGGMRSKEDEVSKLSTSVFVTNFPDLFTAKELWNVCKKYGNVPVNMEVDNVPALVLDESCLNQQNYSYSLIRKVKEISYLSNLKMVLATEGFDNIELKYMGGYWVMIEFQSDVTKTMFETKDHKISQVYDNATDADII